jgi:hypothetical protein
VGTLDRFLPAYDVREVHAIELPCRPEHALAAALALPAAPDAIVRTLFRLRGLRARGTIAEAFPGLGFEELARSDTEIVLGCSGAPWRSRGGLRPFAEAGPGMVRIAFDFRAAPAAAGCRLSTETRVYATDDVARRAFARYWRSVRPFSGLVRRRWLAGVARSVS